MLHTNMKEFVKYLGIETDTAQPGDVFDISKSEYYIDSFNMETQQVEKKKILNVKYQGMKEVCTIFDPLSQKTGEIEYLLKTSKNHHLYDWEKANWVEVGKEKNITLNINGKLVKCAVHKSNKQEPMYDFEVEDNHNYFANGILSKNCTGGEAVNFFPSTRFRVTPKEMITKNGEIVGIKMKIKNYKNKTGIPSRECFLDVYFKDGEDFKKGIDAEGQFLDMALELGIIVQHGAWFYYKEGTPDMTKMQGWGGVQQWFKEHQTEFDEIKTIVNNKLSGYDEILDKNTVEVDEEVEFQKEQLEAKAKREAAISALAEEAASGDSN